MKYEKLTESLIEEYRNKWLNPVRIDNEILNRPVFYKILPTPPPIIIDNTYTKIREDVYAIRGMLYNQNTTKNYNYIFYCNVRSIFDRFKIYTDNVYMDFPDNNIIDFKRELMNDQNDIRVVYNVLELEKLVRDSYVMNIYGYKKEQIITDISIIEYPKYGWERLLSLGEY